MSSHRGTATIKEFEYEDALTGHKVAVIVSPYYSKLVIDERVYYFHKETGEFDGTSVPMAREND